MGNKIIIVGAGGHGKVVYDAINAQGMYTVVGFIDDNQPLGTKIIADTAIIGNSNTIPTLTAAAEYFIVAIGNNEVRKKLFTQIKNHYKPATIIHPQAMLGSNASVGEGSVVLARAIINTNSAVGENAIINSGVIIDHDCSIGNHVHLSIGTLVGSTSTISDLYTSKIGEVIPAFTTK